MVHSRYELDMWINLVGWEYVQSVEYCRPQIYGRERVGVEVDIFDIFRTREVNAVGLLHHLHSVKEHFVHFRSFKLQGVEGWDGVGECGVNRRVVVYYRSCHFRKESCDLG